jgi:hypothetical protein
VDDARVGSWRDYFVMNLLGGDVFPRGVVRWTGKPTHYISLQLIAVYREDMAYL